MTSTPVGMRCPKCAKQRTEVRNIVRQGFGGTAAPATMVLIGINVAFYLIQWLTGGGLINAGGTFFLDVGLWGPAVAAGEWWRLITSGFMHVGLLHLGLNMFLLYMLGTLIEPLIGTRRFVGVYFVALLTGSAGALLLAPDAFTIGASGAVFGLMSAGFLVARDRGLDNLSRQIGALLLLNILFTFSISGISVGGHVGGLLGGALAIALIFRLRGIDGLSRSRRNLVETVALILLALLAALIAIGVASG